MPRFQLPAFLNWSKRIGTLFGVPINLHITLILFLWPALSNSGLGFGYSVEYALLIVLSILLHELGHALTAKRYGLTGLSIMLHGFGGFAVSHGIRSPRQQLVISLMGPAVTFAIGLLCFGIGRFGAGRADLGDAAFMQIYLIGYVGWVNILMGFLNLIPSLPWDGGQALQAILSHRMPEFKAMRAVAQLSLVITPPLFIFAFITNRGFVSLFAVVGFATSLGILLQTGGVKPGEIFADRKAKKDLEAAKRRERDRQDEYLDQVRAREREREERERLRKLFESSGLDD